MKNHFKYSILIVLALLMTVSLVNASPATIGTTSQLWPFESTPTNETWARVGTPTLPDLMNNTDTTDFGVFTLGVATTVTTTLRPNGVGTYTEWPTQYPASTAHWDKVDETTAPPGDIDATYISVNLDAKRDSFAMSNTAAAIPSGAAVRLTVVARDTSATGDDKFRFILVIGGTVYEAPAWSDVNPTYSASSPFGYTAYSYAWTKNPATNGDWDQTAINGLEAGAKSIIVGAPTFTTIRVTQVYVDVLYGDAYFEFNRFENNSASQFPIGYVDIHMKYTTTGTLNDTYKIEYTVGTASWASLQAPVSGAASTIDTGGADSLGRVWSQVAEPSGDGSWSWADIGDLRVRITANLEAPAWDAKSMNIYEIWATVNTPPLPPTSSTAMSIQPSVISGLAAGSSFFVDVYIAGLKPGPNLWGWTFSIVYDTSVITATEYYTFWPFLFKWGGTIDDLDGSVQGVGYSMPMDEAVGYPENNTVAGRVYFTVDAIGSSTLDLINDPKRIPPVVSDLTPMVGSTYTPPLYDAAFKPPTYMSATDALGKPTTIDLTSPLGTKWHEIYPHYSNRWVLTSWEDNPMNPDGVLSPSDQVDMTDATGWIYWFHVDVVTLTIHWSNTTVSEESGMAESEVPMTEMPTGDPTGTRWHQIYGPPKTGETGTGFCRYFTITSWYDTGTIAGAFDPSDHFDFQYDDEYADPWPTHWAHLDAVSTDIILSQKPIPPVPGEPEFPLGIGLLMAIAPAIPIIYKWRTRPKKKVA